MMDIKSRRVGNVAVLQLAGRFDAYAAPAAADWLAEAAATAPANVVVDLAGVSFVDSTACAVLVRAMKRCRDQEGDVRLSGLQRPVRMIFEMTRLDKAFEILPDVETAVAAFASQPE